MTLYNSVEPTLTCLFRFRHVNKSTALKIMITVLISIIHDHSGPLVLPVINVYVRAWGQKLDWKCLGILYVEF